MDTRHLSDEELMFWRYIEQYPRCPEPMLVYADWLEEHRRPEAAGWRILATSQRWPEAITEPVPGHIGMRQFRWLPAAAPTDHHVAHELPACVHHQCQPRYSRPSSALADAALWYTYALQSGHFDSTENDGCINRMPK